MTNLQQFNSDGIELIIDTTTGESFASVSGYARMSGKHQTTISKRLKVMKDVRTKNAQIQTPGGLQGVDLISEKLICEWLPKDNPEMASQLMQLGVRVFLHKLAGYKISSQMVHSKSELAIAHNLKQEITQLREENKLILKTVNEFVTYLAPFRKAIATVQGLDRTMGQFSLDLTEQKQSLKTLQLSNEYLQEINTGTRDQLNQIAEKLESQSNINEAVAEDIVDAAQRKMNDYHAKKAQEFKRIREQNELKKWEQN